jgi:hypothetical protein
MLYFPHSGKPAGSPGHCRCGSALTPPPALPRRLSRGRPPSTPASLPYRMRRRLSSTRHRREPPCCGPRWQVAAVRWGHGGAATGWGAEAGAAGGAAPKGRLQFLLCCRCCQALVNDFFPSTCSALSHGLKGSGGFRWRWDPSPPTTFSPCERQHPSPDALCVLRRERAVLGEATPSLRRLV